MKPVAFFVLLSLALSTFAQPQQPDLAVQRAAMKKLEFLAGTWRGPASVSRGPGEPLKLIQSENVQYKLDGLVMLIEGEGRNADGKRVFGALATVNYDEATGTYRFRAHNDGRFLDTELKIERNGFSWGYTAGPLKVSNTMHVDEQGNWVEVTDSVYNNGPARRSVDMNLQRQK